MSLKEASRRLDINYYSAKTVMQTYKNKGRIKKKLTRDRKRNYKKMINPLENYEGGSNEDKGQKLSKQEGLFRKSLFEIKRVLPPIPKDLTNSRRSAIASSAETADSDLMDRPKFDFQPYVSIIESTYTSHYDRAVNLMKGRASRTLAVPDKFKCLS